MNHDSVGLVLSSFWRISAKLNNQQRDPLNVAAELNQWFCEFKKRTTEEQRASAKQLNS